MSGHGRSNTSRAGDERGRVADWFLIHGDRRVIAALIVLAVAAVVAGLAVTDVIAVGPDSMVATLFGSGLTAGLVTLLTIALSINQLILSRVFGSPDSLRSRLDGTRALRWSVEELAGEPSSPTDPGRFLALLARTLQERATGLERAIGESGWQPPAEVVTAVRDIASYADSIHEQVAGQTNVVRVLEAVLGTQYAEHLVTVHHLQNAHGEALSAAARSEARAVEELLEALAVTRQFVKTLALQQNFAHLSRMIVYAGLVGLIVAVSVTLVYRTGSATLPASVLPAVVTLGIGAVVAPLAAFVAYIVRAATIAHRTVSVGPFKPPSE